MLEKSDAIITVIAVVYCVRYASCIVAKCLFSVLKVDSFYRKLPATYSRARVTHFFGVYFCARFMLIRVILLIYHALLYMYLHCILCLLL